MCSINISLFMFITILALIEKSFGMMTAPLSSTGLFYTQQITITKPISGNSTGNWLTITQPFNGWTFTNNISPIHSYYYAISIQALQMETQNQWLKFNIPLQVVNQTHISLQIKVCLTNLDCFSSVTIRMFAVDYDLRINATTMYSQIQNYFFIQKIFTDQENKLINYSLNSNTSTVSNLNVNYSYVILLSQFNVRDSNGVSNPMRISSYSISFKPNTNFNLSIMVQNQTNFNVTFQLIYYNAYAIESYGRYTFINYTISQLDYNSKLNYTLSLNSRTYLQGEALLFGFRSFLLYYGRVNFTSQITSPRQFTSTAFGLSNNQTIHLQWKIFMKNLCSLNSFYFPDIDKCNATCSQNGYYVSHQVICKLCQNLRCQSCNSTQPDSCLTCDSNTRSLTTILTVKDCIPISGYFQNNQTIAEKCINNCKSCIDNSTCSLCQVGYFYQNTIQTCISLNCSSFITNCGKCKFLSLAEVVCLECADTILYDVKDNNCSQICGNEIIQDSEACDDGNTQNMDGCDSQCKVQDGFECGNITSSMSSNYSNALVSQCIYVKEIQMIKTYLQKIPYQNKVVFRFNFYPNLAVFNKITFYSVITSAFTSNWTGIDLTSLQAKRVEGGQYQNGLFAISFSYNEEWTNNITLEFSPSETNMKPFSSNQSRLLFSENNFRYPTFGQRSIATQRLLVQTSTPSSMVALPSKSDNNLMMFSQSYDVYSICQYFSYFLVSVVWIFWMTGLFYGKPIVVEFVLVIQIILLCVMSTGLLTPGFSGLMLESFVFFCFTGILSDSYQTRPIYDISSPELKSANISIHPLQNLSLYLIILTIILLIGIIARLMQKHSKQYSLVIEKVGQYAFGQFMLYALMPFLLNGNLTTFYYIKSLVLGRNIEILDVLTLLVFHASVIFLVVFSVKNPLFFGQFKTSLLRYDISQHYFLIVTILMTFLGFYYPIMFEQNLDKFSAILPLLIFGFAIAANIIKRPFLDQKHLCRTLSLYIVGVLALITTIAYNFLQQVQILQKYGAIIIIGLQTVLIVLTGYFLIIFIKNQGLLKFYSFKTEHQNGKIFEIQVSQQEQKSFEKPNIDKVMINYYEKQSKLLQSIKKNTLPKVDPLDIQNEYSNLQTMLPVQNDQEYQYNKNDQEQIMDILKNLKNPKAMKNSLKYYLVNQSEQQQKKSSVFSEKYSQKMEKFHESLKNTSNKKEHQKNKIVNISEQKQFDNQVEVIQDFPQELITNYGASQFNQKDVKKIKFENILIDNRKQKKYPDLCQCSKPQLQKVEGITYQMWALQIEQEDRKNLRQNTNQYFSNKRQSQRQHQHR